MKEGLTAIFLVLIGILVLTATGFGIKYVFGPAHVALDRKIFEESKAYVHGKIEHIQRLRLDYETGDETHKAAIRRLVLTEVSTIKDLSEFPVELQVWIRDLRKVR